MPSHYRDFGIVFAAYRIPPQRLLANLAWNNPLLGRRRCRVFIVTDALFSEEVRRQLPPNWFDCVYPKPMEIFNLSAAKNFGIQTALDAGCECVVVTDVDIAWPRMTLQFCYHVQDHYSVVPIYHMATTFQDREATELIDYGCGGTVAMTAANWRRIRYDERYVGYGGEDGQLRHDICQAGLAERRNCHVFHIAHDPTKPQTNLLGSGREDCWNRDSINPDNWGVNRVLFAKYVEHKPD